MKLLQCQADTACEMLQMTAQMSKWQEKHLEKIPIIAFVHSLLICPSNERQAINTRSLLVIRNCYLSHKWSREKPPCSYEVGTAATQRGKEQD